MQGKPPLPCPNEPLAVVGDIHGRVDLLDGLLTKLDRKHPEARKVFVGDYVDRGPDSRQVIDRLRGLADAICLTGNHEEMLLEFIDSPTEYAGRWLRNGGQATLASYGINLNNDASEAEIITASHTFAKAMDDGSATWLRRLPRYWQSGTVFVTHAGPNPVEPIPGQPDHVFTWGHSRFLRQPRIDGFWVAHGHWIQERANWADGRIAVDTGGWSTGRLTAAVILPDGDIKFVSCKR